VISLENSGNFVILFATMELTMETILELDEEAYCFLGGNVGKNNKKDELWKEAYKKCRLSTRHIQMAKDLGLHPRSLIKNIPNPKQKRKLPVRDWIKEMYRKRFKNRGKG